MSIIANAKEIADLVKQLGNIDLYRKIVELEGDIVELTREKHVLEARVEELEEQLKVKSHLRFDRSVYWRIDGQTKDGPYCQHCYDASAKLIRLQDWDHAWHCHACNNSFNK